MHIPRFRLRTLLILVVLSGLGVGAYVLGRRSIEYRRRADAAYREKRRSDYKSRRVVAEFRLFPPRADQVRTIDQVDEEANLWKQRREYYAALESRYRRASLLPFFRVEPDPDVPPEPPSRY